MQSCENYVTFPWYSRKITVGTFPSTDNFIPYRANGAGMWEGYGGTTTKVCKFVKKIFCLN